MRLFGDVPDGGALLADDGANELCGHQDAQRDVRLSLGPDAQAGRAGPGWPAAVEAPPANGRRTLGGDCLVRDVGHLEGVALHHRGVQLLHGSAGRSGGREGREKSVRLGWLRWKLETFFLLITSSELI